MKWLLITAMPNNPGDGFVRLGVQRLIRSVDPDATFDLVNKHTSAMANQVEFDRAVVCGMPLFWCHGVHRCWTEGWWGALEGWISDRPLLLAGVGSFAKWAADPPIANPRGLRNHVERLVARCQSAYVRDPVANQITGLNLPVLPCPSIFSLSEPIETNGLLCNLMADGAHYAEYWPEEAVAWREKVWDVAEILRDAGFTFMSHGQYEEELAHKAGFNSIWYDSHDSSRFASIYSGAKAYFGNRVHGAIMSSAAGADIWSVGYDSRQEAVRLVGGRCNRPSEIDLDELQSWANGTHEQTARNCDAEFEKQREIFKAFAA